MVESIGRIRPAAIAHIRKYAADDARLYAYTQRGGGRVQDLALVSFDVR